MLKHYLSLLILLLPVTICSEKIISADQGGLTEKNILDAWASRQSQNFSFDYRCEGTRFEAIGSIPSGGGTIDGQPPSPAKDSRFAIQCRFIFEQPNKIRYESEGKIWDSNNQKYSDYSGVTTNDGQMDQKYTSESDLDHQLLFIHPPGNDDTTNSIIWLPLILAQRPLAPSPGLVIAESVRLDPKHSTINGIECRKLAVRTRGYPPDIGVSETIWVDPLREFLPLRYLMTKDGFPTIDAQINYQHHEEYGWVPQTWQVSLLGRDGTLLTSNSIEVTQATVNKSFSKDLFTIDPSPGTWVRNYITNERYILKEDKSKRPVLDGEFDGENYEAILNSEPGELLKPQPLSDIWVVVIALAVIFSLILLIRLYRKRNAS